MKATCNSNGINCVNGVPLDPGGGVTTAQRRALLEQRARIFLDEVGDAMEPERLDAMRAIEAALAA